MYTLNPIELETLKTYFNTFDKTGFILSSMFPTSTSILLYRKSNSNFCQCVNYKNINNVIIKNQYLLPLIGKSL